MAENTLDLWILAPKIYILLFQKTPGGLGEDQVQS